MTDDGRSPWQREWEVLFGEHERAEQRAFWLKLLAVLLSFGTLVIAVDVLMSCLLILVLWLQEGIVRTGQARMETRLLQVEAMLRDPGDRAGSAFQLHSAWHAARGGASSLLAEYARHAGRPTVAFPYLVLLVILLLAMI